jgi:hypothetical protein
MARYRSKPTEIEVVTFDPELHIPGVFVKQALSGKWHVWNALHQVHIPIAKGTLLCVHDLNDVYPIAPEVLATRYEPVPFAEFQTVEAMSTIRTEADAMPFTGVECPSCGLLCRTEEHWTEHSASCGLRRKALAKDAEVAQKRAAAASVPAKKVRRGK